MFTTRTIPRLSKPINTRRIEAEASYGQGSLVRETRGIGAVWGVEGRDRKGEGAVHTSPPVQRKSKAVVALFHVVAAVSQPWSPPAATPSHPSNDEEQRPRKRSGGPCLFESDGRAPYSLQTPSGGSSLPPHAPFHVIHACCHVWMQNTKLPHHTRHIFDPTTGYL